MNVQLALLDRLSAYESAALLQPVSGGFRSQAYWTIFMGPLQAEMEALVTTAAAICNSAGAILQTGNPNAAPGLGKQLQDMEAAR